MEDPSKMTIEELRERANRLSAKFDDPNVSDQTKEHWAALAQVYLGEIDRRDSAKIAQRDYIMERWVIILIGLELLLAIAAIIAGWVEGKNQQKVLDQLNKSGAETARTLTAVREAQEASLATQKHTLDNIVAMNGALQDEMDLNITEALQFSGGTGGSGEAQISFSNRGRTALFLWGSKFDGQPSKMRQKATVLVPNNSITFDVSAVIKRLVQTRGGSPQIVIPFELYFKRENGTEYVSQGTLQVNSNNSLWVDRITSIRKQW